MLHNLSFIICLFLITYHKVPKFREYRNLRGGAIV